MQANKKTKATKMKHKLDPDFKRFLAKLKKAGFKKPKDKVTHYWVWTIP